MDTMKVLLGATIGLLVALVVLAFTNLDEDRSAELEKLRLENAQLKAAPPAVVVPTVSVAAPSVAVKVPADTQKELDRLKAELEVANEQVRRRAEVEAAALAEEQELAAVEVTSDVPAKMEKRALAVKNALLLGTVSSYNEDFNIVSFTVQREDVMNRDMVIGIRRNTGIVGRIKITDLETGNGIGEAIVGTFLGGLDIQVGDQLIIPPL